MPVAQHGTRGTTLNTAAAQRRRSLLFRRDLGTQVPALFSSCAQRCCPAPASPSSIPHTWTLCAPTPVISWVPKLPPPHHSCRRASRQPKDEREKIRHDLRPRDKRYRENSHTHCWALKQKMTTQERVSASRQLWESACFGSGGWGGGCPEKQTGCWELLKAENSRRMLNTNRTHSAPRVLHTAFMPDPMRNRKRRALWAERETLTEAISGTIVE